MEIHNLKIEISHYHQREQLLKAELKRDADMKRGALTTVRLDYDDHTFTCKHCHADLPKANRRGKPFPLFG